MEASEQQELLANLQKDYRTAAVSDAERAMLEYAMKLTKEPAAMQAQDVEKLRSHGFDDRAIHDICAITAYFAFVNRIADGLGVELENHHDA